MVIFFLNSKKKHKIFESYFNFIGRFSKVSDKKNEDKSIQSVKNSYNTNVSTTNLLIYNEPNELTFLSKRSEEGIIESNFLKKTSLKTNIKNINKMLLETEKNEVKIIKKCKNKK